MMKKAIFIMSLMVAAGSVFASGSVHHNNTTDVDVTNRFVNHNDLTNQQLQGQLQGQQQGIISNGSFNPTATATIGNVSGGAGGQGGSAYANGGVGVGKASSDSHAHSSSNSSATQDQSQLANANNHNNVQGSQSSSGGNSMSTNYVNQQVKQHHNTPSMALFTPPPTSPCVVTYGGAGAGAGFGFSITGGIRNENCERLEVAKTLIAMNQMNAALEMVCNTDHAKNDDLSICETFRQAKVVKIQVEEAHKQLAQPSKATQTEEMVVSVTENGTKMAKAPNGKMFWFNNVTGQWTALAY
jgi:hypothetical protein